MASAVDCGGFSCYMNIRFAVELSIDIDLVLFSPGLPETLRPQVEAREACAQKKMAASCATLNANI